MVSRNVMSQNLFCKTNKAFWLYLTKYFVSNPNPNNRIRVTRFQQPGTRFLNRVISQLTTISYSKCSNDLPSRIQWWMKKKRVSPFDSVHCFDTTNWVTARADGLQSTRGTISQTLPSATTVEELAKKVYCKTL